DDALVVHGDGLGAAAPRRVDDVGEVGRVADRLVDVVGLHRRRGPRVIERDEDAVATSLSESRGCAQLLDPRLQVPARGALRGGALLYGIQLRAKVGELRLECVL